MRKVVEEHSENIRNSLQISEPDRKFRREALRYETFGKAEDSWALQA